MYNFTIKIYQVINYGEIFYIYLWLSNECSRDRETSGDT